MSFLTLTFFLFFTVLVGVLALTNLIKSPKASVIRRGILLAAGYVFYGWTDWCLCALLIFVTLVAYFTAKNAQGKHKKLAMTVGAAAPLAVLAVFKYFNFFLDSFAKLFNISDFSVLNIILPAGISFYTFQAISYVADVYRGKTKPDSLFNIAVYIAFFPQLLSGPIVKANEFLPQLKEDRRINLGCMEKGVQLFLVGAFKKIVLADRLSVFVNDVFAVPKAFSSLTVILAVIAYAFQIYFDFSGYSDMAVGCAKIMGYDLPKNFNLPYLSKSPKEFWKRWHISLSSWLQEYLYISLGGNRKGVSRTYINLMLTMVLGGLWHGASWTFIVWGALQGLGLCIHRAVDKACKGKKYIPAPVSVVLNFVFISLCWVFFRANTFENAMAVLKKIFVWSGGITQIYSWLVFALVIALGYMLYCSVRSKKEGLGAVKAYPMSLNLNTVWGLALLFFGIMMTFGLAYTGGSPFIYFQF